VIAFQQETGGCLGETTSHVEAVHSWIEWMLVSSSSLLYAAGRPVFLDLFTIKGMTKYCIYEDTVPMSVSREGSPSVEPNSSEIDTSYTTDEEGKPSVYVLGKIVPGYWTTGVSAMHDEILGSGKFQPFVVSVNETNYVCVIAECHMNTSGGLSHVYVILGPHKVMLAFPWNIWKCDGCTLLMPKGYSYSNRRGKTRFSKSSIMTRFFGQFTG